MSFFRFRSKVINRQQNPVGYKLGVPLKLQVSKAEPALMFDSPTRQASVNDLPIPPAGPRFNPRSAPRFTTMKRLPSLKELIRRKA